MAEQSRFHREPARHKEESAMAQARGGSHRSARTGRFVTARTAARNPRGTVTEARGANRSSATAHRSAVTGHYVTARTAARHPNTTVTENGR
jgi:hypothetical protein